MSFGKVSSTNQEMSKGTSKVLPSVSFACQLSTSRFVVFLAPSYTLTLTKDLPTHQQTTAQNTNCAQSAEVCSLPVSDSTTFQYIVVQSQYKFTLTSQGLTPKERWKNESARGAPWNKLG